MAADPAQFRLLPVKGVNLDVPITVWPTAPTCAPPNTACKRRNNWSTRKNAVGIRRLLWAQV